MEKLKSKSYPRITSVGQFILLLYFLLYVDGGKQRLLTGRRDDDSSGHHDSESNNRPCRESVAAQTAPYILSCWAVVAETVVMALAQDSEMR